MSVYVNVRVCECECVHSKNEETHLISNFPEADCIYFYSLVGLQRHILTQADNAIGIRVE